MKTQMELGFSSSNSTPRGVIPRRRLPGARWWFQQMHAVVDQAFDWTTPDARPQQIYMTLPSRRRPILPAAEPIVAE